MSHSAILISENEISREGLLRIIAGSGFDVVESAKSDVSLARGEVPKGALIILDVEQCEESLPILDRLLARHAGAKCIVLAEKFSLNSIMECFQRGAHSVLLKNMNCSQLVAALVLAALGERVVPSEMIDALSQAENRWVASPGQAERSFEGAHLSSRETDVLRCLTAGQSNKEIARRLDLSEATVKVHVKAILRKLKVANRTQAAMWGTANKVVLRPELHDVSCRQEVGFGTRADAGRTVDFTGAAGICEVAHSSAGPVELPD